MKRGLPVCLFLTVSSLALAIDFGGLQPRGYVSDFADAIDPAARQSIERYAANVEKATGAQMAFVTIVTLGGEPVEDVANTLFRKWGIGKKGKDEGVLLLLVVQDRQTRLEVGYGLEPILPDGFAGSLLREMRPALRERHYPDAIMVAAHRIGSRIAEAKGVTLEESAQPRPRRQRQEPLPWPLMLGGLFLFLWLMKSGGGAWLPAMILGNMMSRSSHGHRSGGGFGGYDSGDSFGGFGGGDSGGGGASSDW
jgi:uncharacterized protein